WRHLFEIGSRARGIGSMAKSAGARSEKPEARREDREYQGDNHQRVASKDESHPVIKMSSERSSSTKLEGRLPVHMRDYPTSWQRKTMWAGLTAFFVVLLIIIVGAVIWTGANIISFLQPILIPVAIAMILTYLLDPLVAKMSRGTLSRTKAVAFLFVIAFLALGGLLAWIVPMISVQSANFAKEVPNYTERARDRIVDLIYRFDQTFGLPGGTHGKSPSTRLTNWLIGTPSPSPSPQPAASPSKEVAPSPASETIGPSEQKLSSVERQRIQAYVEKQMPKMEQALPTLMGKFW